MTMKPAAIMPNVPWSAAEVLGDRLLRVGLHDHACTAPTSA